MSRKETWDIGGTLNELAAPGECPERDVIESLNWPVHKDGKSRAKRPGCTKLDSYYNFGEEKIRGIFDHRDIYGRQRIIAVTDRGIWERSYNIDFTQKYLEENANFYGTFKKLYKWQDKLVTIRASSDAIAILGTSDGETWSVLDSYAFLNFDKDLSGFDLIEFFNDSTNKSSLWITLKKTADAAAILLEYDGDSFQEHITGSTNRHAIGLVPFRTNVGDLLFILTSHPAAGNVKFKVHYIKHSEGTGSVDDYDGNTEIDVGKTTLNSKWAHRLGRLFVWNNDLYLVVTVWNAGVSKWTWQIWKFDNSQNTSAAFKFTKIYDSHDDAFYGGLTMIGQWGEMIALQSCDLDANGDPQSNDGSFYRSFDMKNWEKVSDYNLAMISEEMEYEGRLARLGWFISTGNDWVTTEELGMKDTTLFNAEGTIIFSYPQETDPAGGLVEFNGGIYVGKYREILKKSIATKSWNPIYTSKNKVEEPVEFVEWNGRLIISGFEALLLYDGDDISVLGINAPTTAVTTAVGAAGDLTGDYKFVVTFIRGGNFPCESNPSPISSKVTVSSEKIDLSDIPTSTDRNVTGRRIWRTKANGEIFYWQEDINDNTTTSLSDVNVKDDELGKDYLSEENWYDRSIPKEGEHLEVWDNRMWIAGNKEFPNDLFRTNPGTAEEMKNTNFDAVRRREKDKLQNIITYGDDLYLFKRHSRFKFEKTGESGYELNQIPGVVGLKAPRSLKICGPLLIWLSDYGIEISGGEVVLRPVLSELVKKTLSTLNENFLNKVVAGHDENENKYWLAIPTGSNIEPDKVITFDYLKRSFDVYTFPEKITCFGEVEDDDGNKQFVAGTDGGNLWVQGDGTTDDGINISSKFSWGWHYITGEKDLWNVLRRLAMHYVLPDNKTITLKVYRNLRKTPFATISLPGSTPTAGGLDEELRKEIMKIVKLGVRGYCVLFEFSNDEDCGGECRIIGWKAYYAKRFWKRSMKGD